jgi:hypothetical protein
MTRTTISLPDELDAALRREARRRGIPVSQLVREAIEARLGFGEKRRLPFIGLGHSGYSNTAENIDAILESEWAELDRDR